MMNQKRIFAIQNNKHNYDKKHNNMEALIHYRLIVAFLINIQTKIKYYLKSYSGAFKIRIVIHAERICLPNPKWRAFFFDKY